MKKYCILTFISLSILMFILQFATLTSYATVGPTMFDGKQDQTELSQRTTSIAASVVSVTRIVAFAAAVIILLIVAIKYMTAAPSDKAEIKKHMLVYVIGAIILLAASGILAFIQTMANTWFPASKAARINQIQQRMTEVPGGSAEYQDLARELYELQNK